MDFNEYQSKARETAIYPELGNNLWYPTLGLTGESGEVAEKIKKLYRDDKGILTEVKKEELKKELGDVLWYVANISIEAGLKLEDVALGNIQKLQQRLNNNKLHGSGDSR